MPISPKALRPIAILMAATALTPTTVWAQDRGVPPPVPGGASAAPSQQADETDAVGLDDIIVTARKRSENIQETPVAVTAIGGQELTARGADNVSALQQIVPNVTFNPTASNSGSSNAAVIFIRGIGQSDFYPQVDPGVGVYLDGVYISRTTGAVLDSVDIAQVEVLRGPQGTLYGKNTIGGAISILSRRPASEFGGFVETTTGRYGRIDAKARIDLPISDTLRTAFSFATLNRDGYYRLLDRNGQSNGTRLGDVDALTARFAADFEPGGPLTFQVNADWTRRREESAGSTLLRINPTGLAPLVHNTVTAPTLVGGFGGQAFYDNQWLPQDPYTSYSDPARSRSNLDVFGVSLTADWDAADWMDIKSITAYRTSKSDSDRDGDGSPLVILQPATLIDQEQFSQELQFSGDLMDQRLRYLAGLYYLNEEVFFDGPVNIAFVDTTNTAEIRNSSYAAFGQLGYDLTDRLGVTLGARYTIDEKANDARVFATRLIDPGTLTPVPPVALPIQLLVDDASRTDRKFTPAATVDFQFSDDVFGYVTYSQGFKSGGFSQRIAFPRATAPAFDPEEVENYETGLKIEAFDRRVRINSAAFLTNYENLQVIIFNNVEPQTQNGGRARIQGFETEVQANPIEGLDLSFALGYLDASYREINPGTLIPAGARLAYTSEWTLSSSASYEIVLAGVGTLTPRLDWSYRSSSYLDALNTAALLQPAYSLFNGSVVFEDQAGRYKVSAGVTNLTDERYLVGGFSDLAATGFVDGTYARPREWYLAARFNF